MSPLSREYLDSPCPNCGKKEVFLWKNGRPWCSFCGAWAEKPNFLLIFYHYLVHKTTTLYHTRKRGLIIFGISLVCLILISVALFYLTKYSSKLMDISLVKEAVNHYFHSIAFYIIFSISAILFLVTAFGGLDDYYIRSRIKQVLIGVIVFLFVNILFGGSAIGAWFYPQQQEKVTETTAWQDASSKGVSGIQSYLEQNPDSTFAEQARMILVEEQLHSNIEVYDTYVRTTNYRPPVRDAIARVLLDMNASYVNVTVTFSGVPLGASYQQRGFLYTGARIEGEVVLRNNVTQTFFSREIFEFENSQPPSIYLNELDAGPTKPDDAPFPWRDVVTFVEKLLREKMSGGGIDNALTPPSPAPPVIPTGRIVFVSNRDGDQGVYTMNPDGTSQTRITDPHYKIFYCPAPVWSPNGTMIAFIQDLSSIETVNADGSNRTSLALGGFGSYKSLAWSPDGRRIAYEVQAPGGTTGNGEIWVLNVDGSGKELVTSQGSEPSWSPDGTKIAFTSSRDNNQGNNKIYVVNADGTNPTRLTTNRERSDSQPDWSPDGTKIAFASRDLHTLWKNIVVMNADGTNVRVLTDKAWDDAPAWSPDGRHIAFSSDRDIRPNKYDKGNQSLYILTLATNEAQRLTFLEQASDTFPDWGP